MPHPQVLMADAPEKSGTCQRRQCPTSHTILDFSHRVIGMETQICWPRELFLLPVCMCKVKSL
jgi:hypothetical protein